MTLKEITEILKNIADTIEAFATVVAIIVGGIWTYRLFVKKRENYPRAKITHDVTHRRITDDKVLLHVTVTILNTGDLLLSFVDGQIRIQQILPLWYEIQDAVDKGDDPVPEGKTEIAWPSPPGVEPRKLQWKMGEFEIEPGESHEIHCDFILNADTQTVEVYSYFTNIKKRKIGWDLTTLYDLQPEQADLTRSSMTDDKKV